MKKTISKSYLAARCLEILIGLYFFVGAVPKALDIDKFVVQMAAYKVIEAPEFLEPAVLFTVFMEVCLGMALMLGVRLKGLTILALQSITIVFSLLIIYAWRVHGLEDCGCFPMIKMTPPVSLMKNCIILISSIFILWKLVLKARSIDHSDSLSCNSQSNGYKVSKSFIPWQIARIALSVLVASAFAVFAWSDLDHAALVHDETQQGGMYSQFEVFTEQGYFNLAEGWYMVPVMSSSCPECKEKVPELNDLFMLPGLPPMVALCYEDVEGDLDAFKALTNPIFPTHSLGDRALLYFRLIDKEPFRFVLVHDGVSVAAWDGYVPLPEEIEQHINQSNQAG